MRLTIDLLGETMKTGFAKCAIYSRIVEKIYGNPDLHNAVFALYAGSKFPTPSSFYLPASPEEPAQMDPFSSENSIDVPQLEAVCTYNAFSPKPLKPYSEYVEERFDVFEASSALYTLPSLINHSCAANATWTSIGDVIVIRAVQTISIGEEITIPYVGGGLQKRESNLRKWIPSGCQCQLCHEESSTLR